MKKLLIIFLAAAALLLISQSALALSFIQQPYLKQLLTDGDMETSGVGWTSYHSATLTKQTTSPHGGSQLLRVARNGINVFYTSQNVTTAGHVYRVTGYARSDGTTTPNISYGSAVVWTGTTATSWQSFDVKFTATGATIYFGDQSDSSGYVEFDDLFVTEYPGQTKVGVSQKLVDGDMEKSGTTAWGCENGATCTKETTSPHGGKRNIKIKKGIDNANFGDARQTIYTAGKTYRATGWARGDGTSYPRFVGAQYWWTGTASTAWQYFDITFKESGTIVQLVAGGGLTNNYVEFDDVYVTEYPGQTKVGVSQLLVDGDMEKSGVGSWTAATAVISKQTGTPHGGKQVLRVAYDGSHTGGDADQSVQTIGKKYRLTGWARGDGTSVPRVYDGNQYVFSAGTSATTWQRINVTYVATSAILYLDSQNLSAGHYVEFDDVYLTEIPN